MGAQVQAVVLSTLLALFSQKFETKIMAGNGACKSDAVLVLSLLCLSAESASGWERMMPCQRPIHKWLIVSYGLVLASRLLQIAGVAASPAGLEDLFLLSLRPEGAFLKCLTYCSWLVNLPLLFVSSVMGTWALVDAWRTSALCLPSSTERCIFAATWLLLGFLWVAMHMRLAVMALRTEMQHRRVEAELRALESPEVLARWGASALSVTSMEGAPELKGLSSQEIASLPSNTWEAVSGEDEVCSICVDSFETGDCVRCLSACGHTYHQSCIDLWLLRQADCPLCKREVSAIPSCKSREFSNLRLNKSVEP